MKTKVQALQLNRRQQIMESLFVIAVVFFSTTIMANAFMREALQMSQAKLIWTTVFGVVAAGLIIKLIWDILQSNTDSIPKSIVGILIAILTATQYDIVSSLITRIIG